MRLCSYWMIWCLPMLVVSDIPSQAFDTFNFYARSLENGLLVARAPPRQSRSPDSRQQGQNQQAASNAVPVRVSSPSSSRNTHPWHWRITNPSDSLSHSSDTSSSSSRSPSPSNSRSPAPSLPSVRGVAEPPFNARFTKDGRPAPPAQFLDGPSRRNSITGQRQAAESIQTMRNERTGATGNAALLATGQELARVTVNTHQGGTGFIQADPQTTPSSQGRTVPPGAIDGMRMERQNPMREMSVAVRINGPGEITAEAKNPR